MARVPETILIVDDHAGFRDAARDLLDRNGYRVLGEAGDAVGALAEVERLGPDVVLLDIQLPGRDGISVAEELCNRNHPPRILLLSSREASEYGQRLDRLTNCRFLRKDELSGPALAEVLRND